MLTMLLSTVLAASCPTTPAQLAADMAAAAQADVISLGGVNPLVCDLPMTQTWGGGKLLFSDSPESPATTGMLFKSQGLPANSSSNRVFSYHVNSSGATKRFVVVLKNTSSSSGTLIVSRKGTAGPTTSFAYAGKLAYNRWDVSGASAPVTVAAGAVKELDATFNSTNVANGNLLHGIFDYTFSQAHDVYVCMLNTGDAQSTCVTQALLAQDTHQRGTCLNNEKVYDTQSTVDLVLGIRSFPIGGNTDVSVGCATEAGAQFTLAGNYGVLYKLHLGYTGGRLGLCVNPRAGGWGGAVWACPSTDSACGTNQLAGGHFLLPAGSGTSSDNTRCSVEGKYDPAGATKTAWAQFMPTGGSAFPVRWVMVPY